MAVRLSGGSPAQRDFDVGGYEQEELNFNADFSKQLSDSLLLAFGAEWREETYTAVAGEPNSFFGAGSNGLKGIAPSDAGSFARDNIGVYVDLEHDVSDDIVLTSSFGPSNATTDLSLAFGFNEVDVVGQSPVAGVNPVSEGIIEDIENNYPNERLVLTTNTKFGEGWNLLAQANYYGKHFDERGRIGAATSPSAEIGETIYIDVEVGFDIGDKVRLALGAINVFDEFIDEINPPFSNRQSVGLQYPRRSAANYEGGPDT